MNSITRLARVCLRAPGSLLILSGLLLAAMVLFTAAPAHAQQLTGTLSATVYDTSGAVIPEAAVTLKNASSGDVRKTVTDGAGYFTFTAVQPATYSISVSAKGFTTWELNGLVMHLGDSRTVPNIALKAGAESTTVEVVADKNVEVPLDTPEVSTTMNAQQIEDLSLGGRDAGELLKMMPGAAFTNGLGQGSAFNPKVTSTNTGPVGNYSLNGTQPYGSMAYMLDGANLVDPGNAGTQIANINEDMVSEVKVLTGSYGAEYAYGPVIFEAFSKSGGKSLHGEGYFYARNSALNSWESYTKESYNATIKSSNGTPAENAALANTVNPYEYFYYIGGNVGGPVVLPFVKFNRNHDKLFFWGGYEYMLQHPNNPIQYYNEMTQDQRNGLFSNTSFPESNNGNYQYAYYVPAYSLPANATKDSNGNLTIPTADFDSNITTLANLNCKSSIYYPCPNITPTGGSGWGNYAYAPSIPQNRWEATGKLDYAINENTKLSGTYAYQSEVDQRPITIWWAPPNTLPYPAPVSADVTAQVILANFTHQFNATTTNEAVYTFSRFINPNKMSGNAATRQAIGMNVTGLFGHTATQMPNINGPWNGALSNYDQEPFDGPFDGGGFGKLAHVPQFYDTVSKVIGNHTAKAGFYWSQPYNSQSTGCDDGCQSNGQFNIGWPSNYGTNNVVSDFLLGHVANYNQLDNLALDNFKMNQWSIWAQDSWKANKQLTLNLGLRLDHVGQWYGEPDGQQVWSLPGGGLPNAYVDSATAPANTGLTWNAADKSIPVSGFKSPLFYPNPRIGLIYDLFGTGKTVLRAGFGSYHYQDSVNEATTGNVGSGPKGVIDFTTPQAFVGYANITAGGSPPASAQENCWLCGGTVAGDLYGDDRSPNTLDWNVSIDQATKWQSLVEISYVGNHTTGEEFNGGNGNLNNLNNMAPGALWGKDPITGNYISPAPPGCPSGSLPCVSGGVDYVQAYTENHFYPLHQYGQALLLTHQSYEKYNSLQASWRKNGAKLNFQANYTFSKVMGIWDGDTSNGSGNGTTVWPFQLNSNYGPLDYDHTNIFNIWYIYNLPSPIHGNRLLATAINDWKLSGWNTYQAGAYLQANTNGNLNSVFASTKGGLTSSATTPCMQTGTCLFQMPNGLWASQVTPSTWLGSNSVNVLLPELTCNPQKGLKSGEHFNPACFASPSVIGTEGPFQWPYLRGPGYFDNDLSIFKSFPTTESQRIELRVQGQNFVNHPNPQFNLNGTLQDIQENFNPCGNSPSVASCNLTSLGVGNQNSLTTGKPQFTTGQRLMTFSAKYYF